MNKKILFLASFIFLGNWLFSQNSANITLNGEWKLYYGLCDKNAPGTPDELLTKNWSMIPAKVPGNVELDLLASGKIKNPELGNNIYDLRKYEAYQWWYYRTFKTPGFTEGEKVEIVFDGLDCFATIWINNKMVGETDNMLIDHRFDITNLLNRDGNTVYIRINPAIAEARKYITGTVGNRSLFRAEYQHIRKASHMFGWDIMPRLVSAGLWRDVHLDIKKTTRLEQIYWMTNTVDVLKRTASLLLDWQFSTDYPTIDGLDMIVTLKRGLNKVFEQSYPLYTNAGRERISLNNVDFWWPKGYGDPVLYEATVRIVNRKGIILDEKTQKAGIRTAELKYTDITTKENPGEFVFIINGEKIFVRGTNWVPLDALHSRDKTHIDKAIKMVVDLNCNMIRCWGGNVYEGDDFFDLCDENGIMVWQDFSFAGTPYSQDPDFCEKVRVEAVNVVQKLRVHPSLVLWCGNNEIDWYFLRLFNKPINPKYDVISREILPHVIWEFDPLRNFLPSSPYCSEECFKYQMEGLNTNVMPQLHLWGPRGYYKESFYTDVDAHFVSEIGYHGCPNRSSLEKMFDPECVYPWTNDGIWNEQWLTKAVRPHPEYAGWDRRNNLMVNQVKALFGDCPKDLDQFIFASQVVQAEAMKFFIELWRMEKFRKTGIIWWNLKDGWPIISDAIVDYYFSKKLAYYYIRQVMPNACVMIGDPQGGEHPVVAVNDTREEKSGTVVIRDADTGETLFSASFIIPVNGKIVIGRLAENQKQSMWLIDYSIGKEKFTNHYLKGKAPFNMEDYQRWYKKLNIIRE
jgi:beta-mannosidase